MEKSDLEKEPVPAEPQASNNPLYCSYVDGKFTYKDPSSNVQYVWNETEKKWVVKEEAQVDSNKLVSEGEETGEKVGEGSRKGEMMSSPGTSQVQFDGENYTYTDQDGTVFLWDAGKGAWFPKDPPSSTSPALSEGQSGNTSTNGPLPPSPPDLSSTSASTQSIGFFNPNYSVSLTSPAVEVESGGGGGGGGEEAGAGVTSRRFYYASLSPTSMGVNENPGLFLSPDDQVNNNDQPQSLGGGGEGEKEVVVEELVSDVLPPGWEKHEDGNGPYYWHVKSGTIQRERPTLNSPVSSIVSQMSSNPALMIPGGMMSGFVRRSNTVVGGFGSSGSSGVSNACNSEKRKSWVNYLEDNNKQVEFERVREAPQQIHHQMPAYEVDKHTLKFAAVSLGCLSISEEDLTPERSSRAVSKVIAELTSGGKDGRSELPTRIWTHTDTMTLQQQMYLELSDSHLRVKVHKVSEVGQAQVIPVLEQPIHSIRVWGVGREDPRDFAFVAREKQTRQFLCHVFRLEMYARPLASSLRDACKKIMIERNARVGGGSGGVSNGGSKRPTSLGLKKNHNNVEKEKVGGGGTVGQGQSMIFPTPMDEPRKMIKAYYLGSKSVCKPTGMDVLNGAIDGLKQAGVERIPVLVSVAPSVIGITSTTESPPKVQLEVRVRFLSFMGIGTDVRTCGIIIHTARDDFEAHCFYSTPSTGALCKSIEAACVLRYQKCLDAHHVDGVAGGSCGVGCGRATRSNSTAGGGGGGSNSNAVTESTPFLPSSNPSSTATSPKSAAMLAASASANLASAFKTVLSSFGKGKSVDEGK